MASISSLSGSSSSSSIYGSQSYNMISGLASGLDTESMITGLVQSYQQKITSLQQDITSLQWQQESIQSISDKLVELSRNYCTFGYSDHNLMSSSFFNNAVTVTANGTYASLITASGKTSSDVVINAVNQLAAAARYTHSGTNLVPGYSADGTSISVAGEALTDLTSEVDVSNLAGSLTLNYGSRTVSIDFGDRELFTKTDEAGNTVFDAAAFQTAIEKKLSEEQISTSSGTMVAANTLIGVEVSEDGTVSFHDKSSAGNTVSIDGATGNLKNMISNLDSAVEDESSSFQLSWSESNPLTKKVSTAEYLADKTITVTLDGKTKTIKIPSITASESVDATAEEFAADLNTELANAFGAGRVTAEYVNGALSFTTAKGSSLSVAAQDEDIGDILGLGSGISTYLDTSKTLGELNDVFSGLTDTDLMAPMKGEGTPTIKLDEDGNQVTDDDGNLVYVDEAGRQVDKEGYLLDEDGNRIIGHKLFINGVEIGVYNEDTEFNTIINDINSNAEAGVNVSYSKTTGEFVFTAKETGSGGRIEIQDGGLAGALFGAVNPDDVQVDDETGEMIFPAGYTAGQDAEVVVSINGSEEITLTRSSNSFDIDGMNVTVNGEFKLEEGEEAVTFTSKIDADTIVEAVKSFVEDLNEVIKEVKSAYSDMPLQQTDGSKYKPLTEEDMEGMSESAIEKYEEKAKTGILFMDNDLSGLYQELINVVNSSGSDGATLRSIGLSASYSDGVTTLTLDEQALREALESDPNKVQEAFTKSKENGAATDGLMASINNVLDRYAATTGDVKGILIERAGSQYSPTAALDNTILNEMQDIEEEIAEWQDKLSNKVDFYTNKFTQLELLINQMNSQSSALYGMMGG